MKAWTFSLGAIALGALLLGCGSSDSDGPHASSGSCTTLTLEEIKADQVNGWVTAKVAGKNGTGTVRIELNERKGYAQQKGSFDLSKAPDDDYSTANHAVILYFDGTDPSNAKTVYYQSAGTMQLDAVSTPPSRESKGSLSQVKLVEVKLDPSTYETTPVSKGSCYRIDAASWSTVIEDGAACQQASDCGDISLRVCDPTTAKCAKWQCDGSSNSCPNGQMCLAQSFESEVGACYPKCTPFGSSSCPSNTECKVIKYDQSEGACYVRGTAAEGQSCALSDVSTSCAAGLMCTTELQGNVCRKVCDFLSENPACPSGQRCLVGSVCSDQALDPAAIGSPCDGSQPEAAPCGLTGNAVRGVCIMETGGLVCRQVCRKSVATDCPTGKTCHEYFGSLGVCQ